MGKSRYVIHPIRTQADYGGRRGQCGFGDLDFAPHTDPALSTVHVDSSAIGRTAASIVIDRLAGRRIARRVLDLGFTVVERQSA